MADVTFEIPEVLRRYSGGQAQVALDGATVGGVLDALFARFPELRVRTLDPRGRLWPYLLLFRDGRELPRATLLDEPVTGGCVLELIGAAEGGCGGIDPRLDVRMRGFRERTSVDEALRIALAGAAPLPAEDVAVTRCAGRVLADAVTSEVDVPPFRRAAMDGYAVRAEDTFGATDYDPVRLALVGESMPGTGFGGEVPPRSACRIMTGAPVPAGADAVVRAEAAREDGGDVLALEAVPPGKNVGRVGEDVARGRRLFDPGRVLRPQDAGVLASIGHGTVAVVRRPRVRIVLTGNELLPPGERPDGARIVDSNSVMLAALVARDGGEALDPLRLPDDRDALRAVLAESGADVVLVAGGSSVGREDYAPMLVRELGELPVHGIAVRPASPTGVGRIGDARVFLLPGNPVSCLSAYDLFAGPVIRVLAGRCAAWPHRTVRLPAARPVVSEIGRTDYARVRIVDGRVEPLAVSGASVLTSTTRADGFVLVASGSEGFAEGDEVEVFLYDGARGAP